MRSYNVSITSCSLYSTAHTIHSIPTGGIPPHLTTQTDSNPNGSQDLGYLMEAHNGLSAKIVQEAGFKAIWASGLSISAALGVRDNNEASWTQVLDVMDFVTECTDIPVLLDGDTGYGNFNNARRLIGKLERADVAGVRAECLAESLAESLLVQVCLEDKLFPKTNSFIDGE